MKEIKVELGRRGFFGDDYLIIYQELDKQSTALFKDLPNCILSGCVVTPNTDRFDISAGFVWIDGRVMPFSGATYYALPAELVAAAPDATQEVYEVGTLDDVFIDYNATIRAALGTGSFIALSASTRNDFWEQTKNQINYTSKADVSALDALAAIVATKIGPADAWKYIGVDDGTAFQATWSNDASSASNARYRMTAPNKVAIGGVVRNTPPTLNSSLWRIFQLPSGYRPNVKHNIGIRGASYGSVAGRHYFITIDTDGWVQVVGESEENQGLMVALDAVEFYLN